MLETKWFLFVGDGDMHKQIKLESMQKVYDFIFSLDINIMFKGYRGRVCVVPKGIKQLDDYVPCEIFLKYFDVVISGFSGVIKYSTMMDIKTISYMNLVDYTFDRLPNIWRERLDIYSNKKLLYPESFDELKKMLECPNV